MMRDKHGFTLVELIVTLAVFMLVISAAISILIPLVGQFKRQSKIAETNIQGLVGLEILKKDLEQAGYALPWYFNNPIAYTETLNNGVAPANRAAVTDAPNNPPRAIAALNKITFNNQPVNGNNSITGIVTNSDYLVIKSVSVSGTPTAQKWSYISTTNIPKPRLWGTNDLLNTDNVIVINPEQSTSRLRVLMNDPINPAAFYTTFSQTNFPAAFSPNNGIQIPPTIPPTPTLTYMIYGIDTKPLTMPFNRADYFVGIPATLPTRCASGTGVLYKAVLDQDGTFHPSKTTPLVDCVADMQVIFGLDMDGDGTIGTYSNADGSTAGDAVNITGETEGAAASVPGVLTTNPDLANYRSSVVEVRVYILAHEGQKDPTFTFPAAMNPINVGSLWNGDTAQYGRQFDLTTLGDPDWMRYRWKVYTMVVKLQNMR